MLMIRDIIFWSSFLVSLIPVTYSSVVRAQDCSIAGEAEYWVIDYCLWINESDDFSQPGVQECYKEEKEKITEKKECKAREYFKHRICAAHAYYLDGFDEEECFADAGFRGPTVTNDGVKKPPIKSYPP